MNYSLLDTVMAVNVKGPLLVSESFYPHVKASGLKKIVAISSSNGTLTGEKPPRPGRFLSHQQGGVESGHADRGCFCEG